jgi:hypothetical protein
VRADSNIVHQLAAAIDAAPSIVARSPGAFGVVAVHLPGERVDGIRRLDTGRWEVHVVMASDSTVTLVETDVLNATDRLGITDPVDLFIEDIAERQQALPAADETQPLALPPVAQ